MTTKRVPRQVIGTDEVYGKVMPKPGGTVIANVLRETSGPTDLPIGAVADGQILTRSGSSIVGAAPGGGSGAMRVLDLGILNATDLNAGPVTLYTPAVGEFVAITFSTDGYAAHDFDNGSDIFIGQQPSIVGPRRWLLQWVGGSLADQLLDIFGGGASGDRGDGQYALFGHNVALGFAQTDDPIVAVGESLIDSTMLDRAVTAWQASRAYAAGDFVLGSGGIVYQAQGTGTSGLIQPTWPGYNQTVTDNDFDWLGFVRSATAGSIHLYAFVSTPAAP